MTVLRQKNGRAAAKADNTDVSLNGGDGNNVRNYLPLRDRKKKILEIRRQIDKGAYDVDKRLIVVLDHLLEDILV